LAISQIRQDKKNDGPELQPGTSYSLCKVRAPLHVKTLG